MEIIILPILLICFIAYSLIEGKVDGELEHYRNLTHNISKTNLHPLFAIQRGMIGLLIFLWLNTVYNSTYSIIYTISLGLIFSWFHNGQYYCTRNDLNPQIYKKRWKDNSTTSNAIIELDYTERSMLLALGVILFSIITFN